MAESENGDGIRDIVAEWSQGMEAQVESYLPGATGPAWYNKARWSIVGAWSELDWLVDDRPAEDRPDTPAFRADVEASLSRAIHRLITAHDVVQSATVRAMRADKV